MGGIGLNYSLLQIALIYADEGFNPLNELILNVKPNDGNYIVCGEALGVNKINLAEHDKKAITYKQAGTQLYSWLANRLNTGYTGGGHFNKSGKFLTVLGKNVHGDIAHIHDKIMTKPTWEQFVKHQWLDLSSVWIWAEKMNVVEKLAATSLVDIAEALGIEYNSDDLHTSYGDSLLTLKCFKKLDEKFSYKLS